jgi:hypothetical protein
MIGLGKFKSRCLSSHGQEKGLDHPAQGFRPSVLIPSGILFHYSPTDLDSRLQG